MKSLELHLKDGHKFSRGAFHSSPFHEKSPETSQILEMHVGGRKQVVNSLSCKKWEGGNGCSRRRNVLGKVVAKILSDTSKDKLFLN